MTTPVPFSSIPAPQLRTVEHPDMSPVITHFCDRARPQSYIAPDIAQMEAWDRLMSILWESRLRAFTTYSGGDPAACFTEATIAGLEFLINSRLYQPWGLVFTRQSIYDAGGGPVWYARESEYHMLGQLGPRAQAWSVRLAAGSSDWLEEREWRIPVSPPACGAPGVPLGNLQLVALLVGNPNWIPARYDYYQPPGTSEQEYIPCLPLSLRRVPRWWWNPADKRLAQLPPLLP